MSLDNDNEPPHPNQQLLTMTKDQMHLKLLSSSLIITSKSLGSYFNKIVEENWNNYHNIKASQQLVRG